MSANVFANGREVSAEKSDDQSPGAMPDVCLSPPSPPAGPIPLPYPNFSKASDMTDGTKTVKIAGGQAGMKDQSNYKSSKGDEAATRNFGMGVVSHSIQGTTFFAAWSSDVMLEGANAVRFMDMTTHNHGSQTNAPSAIPSTGKPKPALVGDPKCVELEKKMQRAAKNDTKTGRVNSGQVMSTAHHSKQGFLKAGSESLMKKNIKPKAKAGYCNRPKRKNVKGKSTEPNIACTKSSYNNFTANSGHAEGKTIQHLFASASSPGGTLILRIRWNDKGQIRQEPCPACKSAICKTADECKITVELCTRSGNKMTKKKAPCKDGKWKKSLW